MAAADVDHLDPEHNAFLKALYSDAAYLEQCYRRSLIVLVPSIDACRGQTINTTVLQQHTLRPSFLTQGRAIVWPSLIE
jgi:hypothetical protein